MTKMNPDVKAKWVAKLREEGLPQTRGALHQVEPYTPDPTDEDRYFEKPRPTGMCCLGVLCVIAEQEGVVERRGVDEEGRVFYPAPWRNYQGQEEIENEVAVLPPAVREWAGLDQPNPDVQSAGTSLAALNDNGRSFRELADIIEKDL